MGTPSTSELEELTGLLDGHLILLRGKLELMRRIRGCIREGEFDDLAELLAEGEGFDARCAELTAGIRRLRGRLAEAMGMPAEQLTVGRLAEALEGPAAIALNDRRERLLEVAAKLRAESAALAGLLGAMLEFNTQLLRAVAGLGSAGQTYSPEGAVRRPGEITTFEHSV